MIKETLFSDPTILALKKGLDVCSFRQKAIANNIANVTTPGYRAIKVRFEEILREKIDFKLVGKRTNPKHFYIGPIKVEEVEPEIIASREPIPHGGINNVNIDEEMLTLAKNSMNWSAYTQFLSNEYKMLSYAITRGARE